MEIIDSIKELTEDDDKIKAAKIKLLDAKIAHETTKKAEAADAGEDVEKFDTKIAEHEEAKKLLDKEPEPTDEAKTAQEVAEAELEDIADYTKVTQEQLDNDKIEVPATEEGGEPTEKAKWIDVKKFKGKDAEGVDTEEEVIYAKEDSNESVAIVAGTKLNEGMSVSEKFAILMNK